MWSAKRATIKVTNDFRFYCRNTYNRWVHNCIALSSETMFWFSVYSFFHYPNLPQCLLTLKTDRLKIGIKNNIAFRDSNDLISFYFLRNVFTKFGTPLRKRKGWEIIKVRGQDKVKREKIGTF